MSWWWYHRRRWILSTTSSLPLGFCIYILWRAVRPWRWVPGTAILFFGNSSSSFHSLSIVSYARPWPGRCWWGWDFGSKWMRAAYCHWPLLCSWKKNVRLQGLHRLHNFLGNRLLLAVPHFGTGLLHISRWGKIQLQWIFLNCFGFWAWWDTPVIPALGRWREEDHELQISLDYIARPCLKRPNSILRKGNNVFTVGNLESAKKPKGKKKETLNPWTHK
jgi:hypothetical protein